MPLPTHTDIVILGGGNAGLSAALAAAQAAPTAHVHVLDKSPATWAGGNAFFTAGAFRTAHAGLPDLLPLVSNVPAAVAARTDLPPYSRDAFLADLKRLGNGRGDAALAAALVDDSRDAVAWLARLGVRFQLAFERQAYEVGGRWKFWGGLCLRTEGGGKGLVRDLRAAAGRAGVTVCDGVPAKRLLRDEGTGAVVGVVVEHGGVEKVVRAKAVVLAAGGFEANPRMRAQYLGPGWDLAYVRGTPFNTGDCLEMAMRDVGAKQAGHWSGCHSVAWDANAPSDSGDREVSNEFTKSGYPIGLMLNCDGNRFVDEGVDFRNYTYAKFGRAILAQPNGVAFQVWDSKVIPWLRSEEYREEVVRRITASSISELAAKCADDGLQDQNKFIETIETYNKAVMQQRKENPDLKWDPAVKDSLSTQSRTEGLAIPKSNWALPIDEPPFLAVKVGCGITFTFGGLAVNPETAAVISATTNHEIPGLFCAGEMLGGLFYGNYPGGSGLTSGAVFGRRAGKAAAAFASKMRPNGLWQRKPARL